jgi:adenylate cyclase
MTWDELEASGAFDLAGPGAEEIRVLAQQVLEDGVPEAEVVEILRSDNAVDQLISRLLRPGPRLGIDEVVARTGLPRTTLDRIRLAGGVPPVAQGQRDFTDADVRTFELFAAASPLFGEEPLLHYVRIAGSSLARIAEAAVSVFWTRVQGPLSEQNADPEVLAKADLQATQLLAASAPVLDSTYRLHAELAIERMKRARRGGSIETGRLAVGFVDLVGFTSFSEQLSAPRLAEVVEEFEAFAFDVVTEHGGRLVKLIGDAVMFVALDVDDACEIVLTLIERFRADADLVTPRGGLALGEMLIRGGDYYGPVVNLASRAADLAVPYEILVTEPVVESAGRAYRFEPAGRRALKGFAEPVVLASLSRA